MVRQTKPLHCLSERSRRRLRNQSVNSLLLKYRLLALYKSKPEFNVNKETSSPHLADTEGKSEQLNIDPNKSESPNRTVDLSASGYDGVFNYSSSKSETVPPAPRSQVFQEDVLNKLTKIKEQNTRQEGTMNEVVTLLKNMTSRTKKKVDFQFPKDTFPISSIDKLRSLDEMLERNSNARKKLCEIIKRCGGTLVENAVKLTMRELIEDDVLASLCFKGKSGKEPLIKYGNFLSALLDGLNEVRLWGAVTKESFEKCIPKCLKQAADRVIQKRLGLERKKTESGPTTSNSTDLDS